MGDTDSQCQRPKRNTTQHLSRVRIRKCYKIVVFFGWGSKFMRYCELIVNVRTDRNRPRGLRITRFV